MSEQIFHLMHQNDKVCSLLMDTKSGAVKSISNANNSELMPLGVNNDKKRFSQWWKRRAIPMTRKNIPAALRLLNQENTESLLIANLGLSLTDHYWLKPTESEYTWESVNLFQNQFSDALGDFQFSGNSKCLNQIAMLPSTTTFLPSASLQGELQKKWLINTNGDRYLVKGNYGANIQQSLNEFFATYLHKTQNWKQYTTYLPIKIDTLGGTTLGCCCENFANNELEFIPAYDINCQGKKPNDMSEYEYFIHQCVQYGMKEDDVRNFMEYQIATDFILSNTDRHFNNFGVLRDSKTLNFVKMAPIFDTGNSMFWSTQSFGSSFDLLDIPVSSFLKKEVPMLKYIKNKSIVDINNLPSKEAFCSIYLIGDGMSENKINALYDIYNRKISYFEAFQKGKSLSEMQRKGLGKLSVPVTKICDFGEINTNKSNLYKENDLYQSDIEKE